MKLSRACDRCFNMATWQELTAEKGAALLQEIDRGLAVVENDDGADGSEHNGSSGSSSGEGDGFEDDAPDGAEGGARDGEDSKDALAAGKEQLEQNVEALKRIDGKTVSLTERASQYRELTKQMKNASVQ